jgi:hypothetical protein
MNVTNVDRCIIAINSKYYSRLFSKIMPDQHIKYLRHDLRAGIVRDLRFLDDDDRMKIGNGLTKFALKATTLCARLTKR